ncbi:hypothetical protein PoMZ_10787 [Pyricularia oryzae]|uniref:Uncharacterized protein n=1 Tax=Pyricularia oryzae TaxID=318829 RepID=A0A4P7N292_PYROR|nr:hypothetical protein PoMZ_10787 [Pyricularia oryzae]
MYSWYRTEKHACLNDNDGNLYGLAWYSELLGPVSGHLSGYNIIVYKLGSNHVIRRDTVLDPSNHGHEQAVSPVGILAVATKVDKLVERRRLTHGPSPRAAAAVHVAGHVEEAVKVLHRGGIEATQGLGDAVIGAQRQRRRHGHVGASVVGQDLSAAVAEPGQVVRHAAGVVDETGVQVDGEVHLRQVELLRRPRGIVVDGAAPVVVQHAVREVRHARGELVAAEDARRGPEVKRRVDVLTRGRLHRLVDGPDGIDLRFGEADGRVEQGSRAGAAEQAKVKVDRVRLVNDAVHHPVERIKLLDHGGLDGGPGRRRDVARRGQVRPAQPLRQHGLARDNVQPVDGGGAQQHAVKVLGVQQRRREALPAARRAAGVVAVRGLGAVVLRRQLPADHGLDVDGAVAKVDNGLGVVEEEVEPGAAVVPGVGADRREAHARSHLQGRVLDAAADAARARREEAALPRVGQPRLEAHLARRGGGDVDDDAAEVRRGDKAGADAVGARRDQPRDGDVALAGVVRRRDHGDVGDAQGLGEGGASLLAGRGGCQRGRDDRTEDGAGQR